MSFSDYLENALLDHAFGGPDYTRPTTVYLALFTVAPTDAGGGTEVDGDSYERLAVTNNDTNFPAASGGSKANGVEFEFASPGGESPDPWGEVVAMAVFDAATSGNMLGHATLAQARTPQPGDPVSFPAGSLTFTLD